jgi:flagellar basal body-associated protein FliL
MEKNQIKKIGGITLIALIVTIIVLLILAGITINALFGDNGILSTAEETKFKSDVSQIKEELNLYVNANKIDDVATNASKTKVVSGNILDVLGDGTIKQKYEDRIVINNNELVYCGSVEKEQKWCVDLGIKVLNMDSDEDLLTLKMTSDLDNEKSDNHVENSQYQYQITGNLKTKIEERLGRKIDYSIDRFYVVNYKNILPEIEDGKTFIYNSNTGIVTEVTEETRKNTATWYWNFNSSDDKYVAIKEDEDVQDEFFDKLENYNITQMYLYLTIDNIVGNKYVENFVQNAYNRDIKVYLCIGEKTYLNDDLWAESIYDIYDKLEEYNNSVTYDKKMAGISYDAEFWLNSDYNWKQDIDIRTKHLKYIKTAREYAKSKDLETIFTLPFWIVQFNCNDADGNAVNMFGEVTKILEEANLMVYRDTATKIDSLVSNVQSNAEKPLIDYCIENDCTLNIGLEMGQTDEGNNITFYEEETANQGYLATQLEILNNIYSQKTNNYLFSLHHAMVLVNFVGGIDINNTTKKISTAEELKEFLSNEGEMTGKNYVLTNDIDMTGYEVTPCSNLDNGFLGTFDGKNYTISNLKITGSSTGIGLFVKVGTSGVVKNLNIKDSTVEGNYYYVGAITGLNAGNIYNCSNINTTVSGKKYVGGIVGRNYATIENSFSTGNITCVESFVGGISGSNESKGNINNVYGVGTIKDPAGSGNQGAITGGNSGTITNAYWLEGCTNKAMAGPNYTGATKLNEAEMKNNSFIETLNTNIISNSEKASWKIDSENSGYPHF